MPRRTCRVAAGLLLFVLAAAPSGCAKRAWYAREGAGRGAYRPPVTAAADSTAGRWAPVAPAPRATAARPDDERPDPVASGGTALPSFDSLVSSELPWPDEATPQPAPVTTAVTDCASRPCHWVQVTAPADSFGCAAVLARARAIAGAAQPGLSGVGGRIVHGAGLWKVQVGPFAEWAAADRVRNRLRAEGFPEAWLVRQ